MNIKDLEYLFGSTLLLKYTSQDKVPIENGLTVFTPFSDIKEQHTYVCTYDVFQNYAFPLQPKCLCFFVLDIEERCLTDFPEPAADFKGTLFFLRLTWDDFMGKYMDFLSRKGTQIQLKKLKKYQALWTELLHGKPQDFSLFPYRLKKFVSCIVIEDKAGTVMDDSRCFALIQDLGSMFPETNMFPYKGCLIILYSQDRRPGAFLDFSYEEFSRLLEQFHLTAGISNACRHTDMYATLYRTAASAIRLSRRLPLQKSFPNIIQYDEYSTYYIIDLCVREFIHIHRHRDIIYLISPAVIELYRYDKTHNSDLLKTLFSYLLNGRNISETASALYMHRNTVFNKLNKINSIIKLPLEDGNTQFKLLMACFVVTYYQDYLNEQL